MLVSQLCPTLCNLMVCSLPGFSVQGVLQARKLEWVAISSSRGSSQPRGWTLVSHTAGRFFTIWVTKNLLVMWETRVPSLGWEDPLEKGMATYSSIPGASLVAQTVKNLHVTWETWIWSLGQEDSLEKGITTHSSVLAWRIPWTEEPSKLHIVHEVTKSWTWLSN